MCIQVKKKQGKAWHYSSVSFIRKVKAFPEPPIAFLSSSLGHVTTTSWEGKYFQPLGERVGNDSGEPIIASLSGSPLESVYRAPLNVNRKMIDSQNRNENSKVALHSSMKH